MPYVLQGHGEAQTPVAIPGTTLSMTPEQFAVHVFNLLVHLEAMGRLIPEELTSLKAIANLASTGGRLPANIHPVLCDPEAYRVAGEVGPFLLSKAIECAKRTQQLLQPALVPITISMYATTATIGPDWITMVQQGSGGSGAVQGAEIIRRLRALPADRAQTWYKQVATNVGGASRIYYNVAQRYADATVMAAYDSSFWTVVASIAGAAADVFDALLRGTKEVVSFAARTAAELTVAAGGGLLEGLMDALGPLVGIAVAVAGGYLLYRVYKKRKTAALPIPASVGAFPRR
jgi:hypothetical protein